MMTQKEIEQTLNLKPCPFCGATPVTRVDVGGYNGEDYILLTVSCPVCCIEKTKKVCSEDLGFTTGNPLLSLQIKLLNAVEEWNSRAGNG